MASAGSYKQTVNKHSLEMYGFYSWKEWGFGVIC